MDKKEEKAGNHESILAELFGNKQFRTIMLAAVVISVAFLILGRDKTPNDISTLSFSGKPAATAPISTQPQDQHLNGLEKELESKLQATLSKMEGVGQVLVSVSLSSGLKSDFARNDSVTKRTNKETDKANGTRETTEVTENNQLVIPNGASQPVTVMEESPQVAGVLVIAEGARDPKIKEEIHTAVKTLLNIPVSKIIVMPMGGV